jgi:hypothetical protein
MAALTVNGLTVPIKHDSFTEVIREVGDTTQAFDGTLRRSRLATKRDMSFDLQLSDGATGYAWEQLLRGLGEVWPFDSTFYGSKGNAPATTTGFAIAGSFKFGAGGLYCAGAAGPPTMSMTVPTSPGGAWTVMGWQKIDVGSWVHVVFTSASGMWVDGAASGASPSDYGLSMSGSSLTFTGHVTSDYFWDDIVALPFVVPSTWPAVFAARTLAYPLAPVLEVAGDVVVEASTRSVIGSVESQRLLYAWASGSNALHREFSVTLQEA